MANRRLNCTTREGEGQRGITESVWSAYILSPARGPRGPAITSEKMIKRKEEGHLLGVKIAAAAADPERTTDRDPSITMFHVLPNLATRTGQSYLSNQNGYHLEITLCLICEHAWVSSKFTVTVPTML